jgi:hypothetical protein
VCVVCVCVCEQHERHGAAECKGERETSGETKNNQSKQQDALLVVFFDGNHARSAGATCQT